MFDFYKILEVVANDAPQFADNANDAQRITHKESKMKDFKVALCIPSAVYTSNFYRISHVESEKETWDTLVKYYEEGEKVKVVKFPTLRRQYELLQTREDEKIADYVSKIQNLVHLMKGCGEVLIDKMIFDKVMCTLNSHFDHVIVAIQEYNNL